jgi:hypothetical protein
MKDMNNPLIYLLIGVLITILGVIIEKEYLPIKETNSKFWSFLKNKVWLYWKYLIFIVIPISYLFYIFLFIDNTSNYLITITMVFLIVLLGVWFILREKYINLIRKQDLMITELIEKQDLKLSKLDERVKSLIGINEIIIDDKSRNKSNNELESEIVLLQIEFKNFLMEVNSLKRSFSLLEKRIKQ